MAQAPKGYPSMKNNKQHLAKNTLYRKILSFPTIFLKSILRINIIFVIVGVFCLAIASIWTFYIGFEELFRLVYIAHKDFDTYMVCKLLETNLIGVILFVCAVGIYSLFHKDIWVPVWLQLRDVNQLKEKLVGIIITVLGVTFLEYVLKWKMDTGSKNAQEILMFGAAIALVILVLVFYSKVLSSENPHQGV